MQKSEFAVSNALELLDAGAGAEIRFEIAGDSMVLGVQEVIGRVYGVCRVVRGDGELVVVGSASFTNSVPCRRCAEPVVARNDIEFDGRFVSGRSPIVDPDSDLYDPEVFGFDQVGGIDLTELLRETAIASISPNVVCRNECAGLCVVCGNNLNDHDCGCEEYDVDPRWNPLRRLMEESLAHVESDRD